MRVEGTVGLLEEIVADNGRDESSRTGTIGRDRLKSPQRLKGERAQTIRNVR